MQEKIEETTSILRNRKISNIKSTLRNIPIISKNTRKIQEKIQVFYEDDQISSATKNSTNDEQSPSLNLNDIKKASLFEQKYQILDKIGQGANGFVNKCKKIKNNKIYAVKSLMMDQQHIFQLRKNFFAVKQLNHPNIVFYKALYIDMRKKLCYLVMQYVDLPSLEKIKIENYDQLKNIIYMLLQTVKFMHEKNVSHRDLKPSNILYDQENKKIKIIDFGTSKKYLRRNQKFDMLTITGTLFYRAPQMFIGGGYDQKVDMWAIGIMLYKLISGKTPFESSYLSDTIHNIIEKQVKFDESFDKYDNMLKNIIKRMLKKQKSKRLSAYQCLKDTWFYTTVFYGQTELTKSYQQYQSQRNIINKAINNFDQKIVVKNFQTLNYVIQQVDGQDYHKIDSQDEENKCKFKSNKDIDINDNDKKIKIKSFCSMLF